jgi:hypothetical protein
MKNIFFAFFIIASLWGCKKKSNNSSSSTTSSTTTGPVSTSTCCSAPFVATTTLTSNPDSVYLPNSFSNKWRKEYFVITDGINSDTVSTDGFNGYINNPSGQTDCKYYKEFGNTFGSTYSTGHYFKQPTYTIFLPKDSVNVIGFPKGKYGFEKSYGASFANDMPARCKGSLHLQFKLNNVTYRSLPQSSTTTYHHEIQQIKYYKNNISSITYSIKGVGKILMENQNDLTTIVVNFKYRKLVMYSL